MEAQDHTLTQRKQEDRKREIVRVLSEGDSRTEACYAAQISRQTLYNWLREDEAFAHEVRMAEEEAASLIEGVLFRCARKAEFDPRYQRSLKLYLERRDRRLEKRQQERRRKKAEDRAAEARRKKAAERASSPLRKHLAALKEKEKQYAWLRGEAPPPPDIGARAPSQPGQPTQHGTPTPGTPTPRP